MKIKLLNVILTMFLIFPLTGCWDSIDINKKALITLVGVDKVGDRVRLVLEDTPVKQSQSSGGGGGGGETAPPPSKLIIGEGISFSRARGAYIKRNASDVYMGSIRSIVFSDSFAKDGIEPYINRIAALREYRKTAYAFTSTTRLEELLDSKKLNSDNIGLDIEQMYDHLTKSNVILYSNIADIAENLLVKDTGFLMANLAVVSDAIEVTGYSIFKDDKKIGFIEQYRMKYINTLVSDNVVDEYAFDFENIKVELKGQLKKRNIEAGLDNKNISFNIKISKDFEIIGLSEMKTINNEKMNELGKIISESIKKSLLEEIKISQDQYGCDYFEFYKYFRAKYSADFKDMNWNEEYKKAQFNVEVNTKIIPTNIIYDIKR